MGEKKKTSIVIGIMFCFCFCRGQECSKANMNLDNPYRKYYLIDTILNYTSNILELSDIDRKKIDSFRNYGQRSNNFKKLMEFYEIKPIESTLNSFYNDSIDAIVLNKKYKILNKKRDRILVNINQRTINSQPTTRLERKLNQRKYHELSKLLDSEFPFAYMFGPIYFLDDRMLIMYDVIVKGRQGSLKFVHFICKKPKGLKL